jgi:AcrR family transcriptional regulator
MGLREKKKLETWRGIRTAALTLFGERGYEATTIEEIAEAANVSRATFFNYFPNKEALVFDEDPEERKNWRSLMDGRDEEPLWEALVAVLLAFNETLRDRMPLQRRLKQDSPSLARSSENFGRQFLEELRAWVAARPEAGSGRTASLQLNVAVAAMSTAYQEWDADESFDDYLARLRQNLRLAKPALAVRRTARRRAQERTRP